MKINKDNYELFFIDYIDGKLSAHDTADLMIFLAENPDLDEETSNLNKINLKSERIMFPNKDSLKRTEKIIPGSFDDKCIAYIENDLSIKEKIEFEQIISNDNEKKKEFSNYKNTILVADKAIIFNNKKKLKKSVVFNLRRAQVISYLSSAAAVIIFVLAFNFYNQTSEQDEYSKTNYSYLDQSMIEKVKEAIENFNDGFIPDLR